LEISYKFERRRMKPLAGDEDAVLHAEDFGNSKVPEQSRKT
jgi:hypothetical protein